MKVEKIRDLTLIHMDNNKIMVVACDSCGGIGLKSGDTLKVPPFITGKFTARVGIMEVICTGAEIVTLANNVCNEMYDTGTEIIKGVKEELKSSGIDEISLTGSTEENFPTNSTALGITVIGVADKNTLKINKIYEPAALVSIGIPKVGNEIDFIQDKDIIDYNTIKYLLSLEKVFEMVPVGSKGILYEAETLAKFNNKRLFIRENLKVNINKSAGPSTCIIAAVNKKSINILSQLNNVNFIGDLA
ncbi:MAG: alpha-ribazole-5-phosphate synthase [Bacillota bacterium]|nr:alpha-ribazole-5-phosphate synthase [Bacillota bacterium]